MSAQRMVRINQAPRWIKWRMKFICSSTIITQLMREWYCSSKLSRWIRKSWLFVYTGWWSRFGKRNNYRRSESKGQFSQSTNKTIRELSSDHHSEHRIYIAIPSPATNEIEGSYEVGFVNGRSTTEQIFIRRKILHKCPEYQIPNQTPEPAAKKVRLCIKFIMYRTLIRPVVLYKHDTWSMLDEHMKALGVF